MIVIVMGVSGSGKSTVGKLLAKTLGVSFYDADDFHPLCNVSKMKQGKPLTDKDRMPWLASLAQKMKTWDSAVIACSALKESYRQLLMKEVQKIEWVYLQGTKALISQRMKKRTGHFMKASMLDSQFQTLEAPTYGYHVSIAEDPKEIVKDLYLQLNHENS